MEPQAKPRFRLLKVLIVISIVWSALVGILMVGTQNYTVLKLLDAIVGTPWGIINFILSIILVPINPIALLFGQKGAMVREFLIQPMALIMLAAASWGAYKLGVSKRNYAALALVIAGLYLYCWRLIQLLYLIIPYFYNRGFIDFTFQSIAMGLIVLSLMLIVHYKLWAMAFRWYRRGVAQNISEEKLN